MTDGRRWLRTLHRRRNFEARLPGSAQAVVAAGKLLRARLTWMDLRGLLLVHARETVRPAGYLSLPDRLSVLFPLDRSSVLVCDGMEIKAGEIVLYGDGARTHQRTLGSTRWSLISLETTVLRDLGMILVGRDFETCLA